MFRQPCKDMSEDVLTHTFSFDRLIRQQLDVLDQYIKDNRSCIVHTGKNFICYVLIKRLVKCKKKNTFPALFLWPLSTKEKSHFLLDFYGHFQQKKSHISCMIFMATFNTIFFFGPVGCLQVEEGRGHRQGKLTTLFSYQLIKSNKPVGAIFSLTNSVLTGQSVSS